MNTSFSVVSTDTEPPWYVDVDTFYNGRYYFFLNVKINADIS